jgi:23S rRNA pseudouridine2605 synthase
VSRPVETPSDSAPAEGERLQKVMAAAGIGSRRHCEELILAGRVEVDRQVVRKLGTRVDREQQEIRVDGEPLKSTRLSYYLVNKPVGVVSTNFDPSGRPRVIDLLPPTKERLFTVGRLDLSSEGLMLVTNDGELANRLTHPRYGVEKTYHALVAGRPEPEVFESLRRGVRLAEGVARVVSVKVKNEIKQSTLLEIVLAEGRNREIRRILAKVGHKVLRLKRVAVGSLRLKDLAPGEWRPLGRDEVESLRRKAGPRRARRSGAKR